MSGGGVKSEFILDILFVTPACNANSLAMNHLTAVKAAISHPESYFAANLAVHARVVVLSFCVCCRSRN